jgi:PilZ domain
MQYGRLERRMVMSLAARLEIPGEPPVVEPVVIENISRQGARIVAKRSCLVQDSVIITDLLGAFRLDARVIYCESLVDGQCAIGLRFREAVPLALG